MDEDRKETIDKMRNPALMRAKKNAVALEAGEVATVKGSFGKVALRLLWRRFALKRQRQRRGQNRRPASGR